MIYIYTVYNIYTVYIYILIYSSWSYAQPVTSAVLNWGSQVTSVSPQSWIIGSSLRILFWSLLCRLWRKPNFGKAKSCAMAFKNRLSCFLFLRQNLSKPTTPQIRNFWMFTSLFTLFHIGKFSVANFSHSQPRRHQVAMALDLTPVPGEFLAGSSICVARIYIMCIWRNT